MQRCNVLESIGNRSLSVRSVEPLRLETVNTKEKGVTMRKTLTNVVAVLCLAGIGLLLSLPVVCEEGTQPTPPPRPKPIPPEKLAEIWKAEITCVAEASKVGADNTAKVVEAYVSARKGFAEKAEALPRGQEGFQQRRELGQKAAADLKEALTKIAGAEKTDKIIGMLGPFERSSFLLDRMVGDLIDFKLAKEKLNQGMLDVLEYNAATGKLMAEAAKAGSFESVREKMQPLREELNKKLAKVLTKEQLATWTEKYARGGFGGPRRQPQ